MLIFKKVKFVGLSDTWPYKRKSRATAGVGDKHNLICVTSNGDVSIWVKNFLRNAKQTNDQRWYSWYNKGSVFKDPF
jgi:hypothetical protein